jgi:ribosome-binding factor A
MIQEKLGELIVEGKVKDYRVDGFLSITRVDISSDLSYADVYVSSFKGESSLSRCVEGLQSAAGYIQSRLARFLRVRQTPRLRFHAGMSLEDSFLLNRKIDELVADNQDQYPAPSH